jgi:ubiquitin-protein ligase
MTENNELSRKTQERLVKAVKELKKKRVMHFQAIQNEMDPLIFYFVLKGENKSDYEKGYYIGQIKLPKNFPDDPPDLIMLTPNGRFRINNKICLTITGFHKETWTPIWTIYKILDAFNSIFICDNDEGLAHIKESPQNRKYLARDSVSFNLINYKSIFLQFDQYVNPNGTLKTDKEIEDFINVKKDKKDKKDKKNKKHNENDHQSDLTNTQSINTDSTNTNSTNTNSTNTNSINTNSTNTELTNTDLTNTDLTNKNLTNIDLTNTELTNTELTNTDLTNKNFTNTDLTNTDLTNTELINTELINTDLTNTELIENNKIEEPMEMNETDNSINKKNKKHKKHKKHKKDDNVGGTELIENSVNNKTTYLEEPIEFDETVEIEEEPNQLIKLVGCVQTMNINTFNSTIFENIDNIISKKYEMYKNCNVK